MRFALIGCGRIAQKHAEVLGSGALEGTRLVAVCDSNLSRAQELGGKYSVPSFPDYHQMLRELGSEIDVVCILTPSGDHAAHCLEVAKYKKHVVVEKPMALTLADADAMIRACEEAGVRLFVVKQNRYNTAVQKLREALDSGRFGKLVMGTVRVRWCRKQDYYDRDSWRGTWAEDGGVFANQASHHVDLLAWMLGDVQSVFAKARTALVNVEVEDTGIALLQFKNGALGVVEATTAARPKDLEGSISILGEYGTVEIAGFAVNEMKVWQFTDARDDDQGVLEKYRQNPVNVYGFGHFKYLEHVVDCLRDGRAAMVDGLEGRKSLELIISIYESIASGREVPVDGKAEHVRLGKRKQ